VSPSLFQRWQIEERFVAEFEKRIICVHRRSRLVLAQNATAAADKLVELTQSQNPETARRACLDIISLHGSADQQESPGPASDAAGQSSAQAVPSETASRLLAALARNEPPVSRDSAGEHFASATQGSLRRSLGMAPVS